MFFNYLYTSRNVLTLLCLISTRENLISLDPKRTVEFRYFSHVVILQTEQIVFRKRSHRETLQGDKVEETLHALQHGIVKAILPVCKYQRFITLES